MSNKYGSVEPCWIWGIGFSFSMYILNINHIKDIEICISSDLRIHKVPAFDPAAYNYSDNYEVGINKYWKS